MVDWRVGRRLDVEQQGGVRWLRRAVPPAQSLRVTAVMKFRDQLLGSGDSLIVTVEHRRNSCYVCGARALYWMGPRSAQTWLPEHFLCEPCAEPRMVLYTL